MKKILFVFGTRPELIKMAPIILRMKQFPQDFEVCVCNSAQHRDMLSGLLDLFGIEVDIDLNIMKPDQDLFDITSGLLNAMKKEVFQVFKPDWVFAQGDTTTTLSAAMSSFYLKIPLAHVEAGLRTYRMDSPFPEEFNRRVCSLIANRHYCPTKKAESNLIKEGVSKENILVTGNTGIDSIQWLLGNYDDRFFRQNILNTCESIGDLIDSGRKIVLITLHRREHFGSTFLGIIHAIKTLAENFPNVSWVYPVHPNPNVSGPVNDHLQNISNIHLLPPMDYVSFIYLMKLSYCVITDSGGVQEEAPSLGKPILVLRETTERPEGIEAGTALLAGNDPDRIIDMATEMLTNEELYQKMSGVQNPYGDGNAAKMIVDDLKTFF